MTTMLANYGLKVQALAALLTLGLLCPSAWARMPEPQRQQAMKQNVSNRGAGPTFRERLARPLQKLGLRLQIREYRRGGNYLAPSTVKAKLAAMKATPQERAAYLKSYAQAGAVHDFENLILNRGSAWVDYTEALKKHGHKAAARLMRPNEKELDDYPGHRLRWGIMFHPDAAIDTLKKQLTPGSLRNDDIKKQIKILKTLPAH